MYDARHSTETVPPMTRCESCDAQHRAHEDRVYGERGDASLVPLANAAIPGACDSERVKLAGECGAGLRPPPPSLCAPLRSHKPDCVCTDCARRHTGARPRSRTRALTATSAPGPTRPHLRRDRLGPHRRRDSSGVLDVWCFAAERKMIEYPFEVSLYRSYPSTLSTLGTPFAPMYHPYPSCLVPVFR